MRACLPRLPRGGTTGATACIRCHHHLESPAASQHVRIHKADTKSCGKCLPPYPQRQRAVRTLRLSNPGGVGGNGSDHDRWSDFVITPALMLGMEDIILDRMAFGGVKELEEIYAE